MGAGAEWLMIILTILVVILIWIFGKWHSKIKSLSDKIDRIYDKINIEMKSQTSRTDQLYQMFIDLLNKKN